VQCDEKVQLVNMTSIYSVTFKFFSLIFFVLFLFSDTNSTREFLKVLGKLFGEDSLQVSYQYTGIEINLIANVIQSCL